MKPCNLIRATLTVGSWAIAIGASAQGRPDVQLMLDGHATPPQVAYTMGGHQFVCTNKNDGVLALWDTRTRRLVRSRQYSANNLAVACDPARPVAVTAGWYLTFHRTPGLEHLGTGVLTGTALSVSYAPDGSTLIVPTSSSDLYIYDAETFQDIRSIHILDRVRALFTAAIGPKGLYCASILDSYLRVHDISTGEELWSIWVPAFGNASLAFSPDGKTLAVATDGNTIELRDPRTGVMKGEFRNVAHSVTSVTWTPDGGTLIALSTGAVEAWRLSDKRRTAYFPLTDGSYGKLSYSPDRGTVLVSGQSVVREYAFPSFELLGESGSPHRWAKGAEWSDDGRQLAGRVDGTESITACDSTTGATKMILRSPGTVMGPFAWDAASKKIAVPIQSLAYTMETAKGDVIAKLRPLFAGSRSQWSRGTCARYSPDKKLVYCGFFDGKGTLACLDPDTGAVKWCVRSASMGEPEFVLSPSGDQILVCSMDGSKQAQLRDSHTGKLLTTYNVRCTCDMMGFSPDGTSLFVLVPPLLRQLKTSTGSLIRQVSLPLYAWKLALAKNGARILVSGNQELAVLDGQTFETVALYTEEMMEIEQLSFSPDGTRFLISREDGVSFVARTP